MNGADTLRSAATVAAEGALSVEELLGVLRDAARALAELHARGRVHGAVCPDNIVVDAEGVARLCRDTVSPPDPAPEQRRGQPPDVRSDVYGLGAAVLALAGHTAALPQPVSRMLAKMTGEEPAARYQSMDEVLLALEACELMTRCRARRPGRGPAELRRRRIELALVVVVLALLMLTLALIAVLGETPPARGRPPESHDALKELLDKTSRPARK